MLRPAAVRGTMTFMDPRWAALSPAVGAASAGGDAVLANLYRLGGPCAPGLAPFPAACALARALYYATDGGASRPAPARTRSRPGYYLDHGALGALVAQARDGAGPAGFCCSFYSFAQTRNGAGRGGEGGQR